jgi:hypothetical protein
VKGLEKERIGLAREAAKQCGVRLGKTLKMTNA